MKVFFEILMKKKHGARNTTILGRLTLPEAATVARDAESKGWVEVGVWRKEGNRSHHVPRAEWEKA